MTLKELKDALDLIDEGCARLFGTDDETIAEARTKIMAALEHLYSILNEVEA